MITLSIDLAALVIGLLIGVILGAVIVLWAELRDGVRGIGAIIQAGNLAVNLVMNTKIRRRNNMKRWIVVVLVLALGLVLIGCSTGKIDSQEIAKSEIDNRMFLTISDEYCGIVVVDKTTRVMYWLSDGGYSHGILTLLVNPDGTPRIWEG